jgi:hypothetical protein
MSSVSSRPEIGPIEQPPARAIGAAAAPSVVQLPSGLERNINLKTSNELHELFTETLAPPAPLEKTRGSTGLHQLLPRTVESAAQFIKNGVHATQSAEGNSGGVLFVQSPEGKRLVLKFTDEPEKVTVANKFYELASVKTAKAASFAVSSEVGTATRDLLSKHLAPSSEASKHIELAKQDPGRLKSLLTSIPKNDRAHLQLEVRSNILAMDHLQGESWTTNDFGKKQDIIKDDAFAKDVGKMLFLDTLLGNEDRLISGNMGIS